MPRTPEGEVLNRLRTRARNRALSYLSRTYRQAYEERLAEVRLETGGCLAHRSKDCPMGRNAHRREYQMLLHITRYRVLAGLAREHPAAYKDAYDGELEWLLEVEGVNAS